MSLPNKGDKVTITIRGRVSSDSGIIAHSFNHQIVDEQGYTHWVHLNSANERGNGTTVEVMPAYEAGKAYEDSDGDVFIRTHEGKWVDKFGDTEADTYPARPLQLLTK